MLVWFADEISFSIRRSNKWMYSTFTGWYGKWANVIYQHSSTFSKNFGTH